MHLWQGQRSGKALGVVDLLSPRAVISDSEGAACTY